MTRSEPQTSEAVPRPRLTTYYNGACPVCGAGIRHFKNVSRAQNRDLVWCDISRDRFLLAKLGLETEAVQRRLHVFDRDGRLQIGVDAFAEIWSELSGYRWLARIARAPVAGALLRAFYDHLLSPALYAWNRWRGRNTGLAALSERDMEGQSVRPPLFVRLVGQEYDELPQAVRDMHRFRQSKLVEGRGKVERGANPVARLIAGLMGLPRASEDVPVTVAFAAYGATEVWRRDFAGVCFKTSLEEGRGRYRGHVIERFGPVAIAMKLVASPDGLIYDPTRLLVFGLPLPRVFAARTSAREGVTDGRFTFDVSIGLPLIGLLISYRGWLQPVLHGGESLARSKPSQDRSLMLFDGVCNLCTGAVQFFLKQDRAGRIRFAAMQSQAGEAKLRELGLPLRDYASLAVLADGRLYQKTDAIILLVAELPRPWCWLRVARIVPKGPRDRGYDWITRNRYRFLGRKDQCMVPTADIASRFLV